MTTILNASNGATSGLIATGDASGILQLQTNNGTPALTLNTTQALGVGSSPSYGTSGQLLQSNGSSAAPSWVASPATNPAGSTGQLQYNNSGSFDAVTDGTTGQVLTSAGSGSVPTWTTPSSGAMTLISTQTVSSGSSIQWTGLSGYRTYLMILNNIVQSAFDHLWVQFGTGSTTWITSSYIYSSVIPNTYTGSAYLNYSTNTSGVDLWQTGGGGSQSPGLAGTAYITNMLSTSSADPRSITFSTGAGTGGNSRMYCPAGTGNVSGISSVCTAIRLIPNSGNITGTASLYGISS